MGQERLIDPQKVAIYIRWSTDDQGAGTTLEVQQDGCRHYVLSQGWQVNDDLVFIDDGYSGGSLNRPALARLRTLVTTAKVDCVVVFKLDRLSRSVVDMVNLVLEEWDGLTHVKSAREPIDTASAMGKQFFYMLVSFAEWERSVIRERTTAGRLARAREGYKASSRAPYGYRHGPATGSYAVEPAEGPVVQRIFEQYGRGMGAGAIAAQLNDDGVPFRGGAPWSERTLLYLLSNPVYTGTAVYGRLTRNPRRAKSADEPFWLKNAQTTVVAASPFIPALVSSETFALTQKVKARRRIHQSGNTTPSPRAEASPYLITGLARCRCGASLFARRERRDGRAFEYYACLGKKQGGTGFCTAPNMPRHLLDRAVESELMLRYGERVSPDRYQSGALHALDRDLAEAAAAIAQLDQRLARLQVQDHLIRQQYRDQAITLAEFRSLRHDVQGELQETQRRQKQTAARRGALAAQRTTWSARLRTSDHLDKWGDLNPTERKQLLRCFAGDVTAWIDPADSAIHLNIEWRSDNSIP